jgi:hypothetical protein
LPIEGATNASYIIDPTGIFDGGIYYCEVFNGAGLIKSDDIMMSVKPKAMVVSGPVDISAYDGDTVIFNQSVVGALPIGYQWQKDGVDIPGAVFHTYTIHNVGPDDIGDYRSIVSNECHTDTSATAKLEVSPGPGVDENPAGWPFNVVPNPAATVLTITPDQNSIISACSILTLHGDVLYNHERKIGGSFTIPVVQLSPGLYILKVSTGHRSYGYKFIRN